MLVYISRCVTSMRPVSAKQVQPPLAEQGIFVLDCWTEPEKRRGRGSHTHWVEDASFSDILKNKCHQSGALPAAQQRRAAASQSNNNKTQNERRPARAPRTHARCVQPTCIRLGLLPRVGELSLPPVPSPPPPLSGDPGDPGVRGEPPLPILPSPPPMGELERERLARRRRSAALRLRRLRAISAAMRFSSSISS